MQIEVPDDLSKCTPEELAEVNRRLDEASRAARLAEAPRWAVHLDQWLVREPKHRRITAWQIAIAALIMLLMSASGIAAYAKIFWFHFQEAKRQLEVKL